MNPNKLLFNRILQDEELVELLRQMNVDNWKELSIFEREELFTNLMKKIFGLFEETNRFSLKYVYKKNLFGESDGDTCFVNGEILNDDNPYIVLFDTLHEYRHCLQNVGEYLYEKKGRVFEVFGLDEIKAIIANNKESCLSGTSNYVSGGQYDHYEYLIQPIEHDANDFAYKFLEHVMRKINNNQIDLEYINKTNNKYMNEMDNITYSDSDIINFGKIYKLNYEDYVSDNACVFEDEKEVFAKYTYLKDNLDLVDKEQIYCLFIPAFWKKFDLDERTCIVNRFFELHGYDIEAYVEGCMFIDGESIASYKSFDVLERMFNLMAERELIKLSKKSEEDLNENEKLILFNLKYENRIGQDDNPLIYHVQPYMTFTHNFVLDYSKKFYSIMEKTLDFENYYFEDYKKIYSNNDVETMIKKVKLITGDNPLVAYKKALKQKPKVYRKSLLV